MCGICRTVNCIRRRLFGCGCNNGCGSFYNNGCNDGCNDGYSTYSYRGCDSDCAYEYRNGRSSRYTEPCMNVTCANQRDNGFEPCCDDNDCNCRKHRHDCCD